MRLKSVQAVRYGALCDATLGPLAPGLTVVLGPNEAGKSTYTALIRHLVYGFVHRGRTERGYHTATGDARSGRLIFVDEMGAEWTLTRSGDVRRGDLSLVGPEGPADAEPFLESIRGGVSEEVYRQVFGFDLGELADFGSLEGIRTHLLASVAGLETDPHAVLTRIEKRRDALYTSAGRTKVIHKLVSELRQIRADRSDLEAEAESFTSQRSEAARLTEELVQARLTADESTLHARTLATLMVRMADARTRIGAAREDAGAIEARIARLGEEAGAIPVNEEIVDRADAILSLADRGDDVEVALDELREARAEVDAARTRSTESRARLGATYAPERVEQLAADASFETAIEEHSALIARAEDARDRAHEEVARADGIAATAATTASDSARRAGVDPDAGLSGLLTAGESTDTAGPTGRTTVPFFVAVAGGILGALLAILGMIRDVPIAAIVGVVLLVVAVVGVAAASLRNSSGSLSTSGRRASLEEARIRLAEAEAAARDLDGARAQLEAAEQLSADQTEAWASWCGDVGLPEGISPAESRGFLVSVRQAADAEGRVVQAGQRIERAEHAVARYTRLADDAGIAVDATPDSLPALVRAEATAAVREREAAVRRDDVLGKVSEAREELDRTAARLTEANEDMRGILDEAEVRTDAELEAASTRADEEATEARSRVEGLTERRAEASTILGDDGREDRQAALSLDAARVTEELRSALTEYTVLSLAGRMLATTLEAYERERQPGVVRRAEEMFSKITDGRYVRLTSPVGTFDPHIVDPDGEAKDREQLSTGTAQQLYLALRLAYLESLADSPVSVPVLMDDVLVNFDEQRREETARLLVEFAASHQTVFFTCHEATADVLLAAAGDDIVRLELTHC